MEKPMQPSFADLSEEPAAEHLPPLDQPVVGEAALTPQQLAWRRDGVLILPRFLPASLMDAYSERRAALNLPGGWPYPTPYLEIPELRELALYPPLMEQMRELIGEQMMLHLCLTGWVSTERDWHQDDYLNPPFVNSWYAAVWMALDDIHPDSGPFEYVPGSHRWPLMRGEKVRARLPWRQAMQNSWPTVSESFVVPAIEAEIARRRAKVDQFIAKRGDVLIWHGRLFHRGSKPRAPSIMRKALICHYTGALHRRDMPKRARDANGQIYAIIKPRSTLRRALKTLLQRAVASTESASYS
jgi:ectoine hydroxylase-related dioxygenase (phytanoyl-CoA dioxygenase family)